MLFLKVLLNLLLIINISCLMQLKNFHNDYPYARVVYRKCGDTVSLSCRTERDNNPIQSSLKEPVMWFRLYENAYPLPLILGDRQLIADQRFMLRTQNNDRHLEIIGARKDDQGYYICKTGNTIRSSYNLTILTSTCIDIQPHTLQVNLNENIHLVCGIRSTDAFSAENIRVQWTHNEYSLTNIAECLSNYSSVDGVLYETLIIKRAQKFHNGTYQCRYGPNLIATAYVIVNQYPGGSKSRRLISTTNSYSLSSKASLRTVVSCFYIVYQFVFSIVNI